jgi:hypothetical protein
LVAACAAGFFVLVCGGAAFDWANAAPGSKNENMIAAINKRMSASAYNSLSS